MQLRELRHGDASDVQQVAQESLAESYSHAFDEELIGTLVERWYNEDAIETLLSEEGGMFIIADNGQLQGFIQGQVLGSDPVIGDIYWVHVRPEQRGEGIGSQLLGELMDKMESDGVVLARGHVLSVNQDGVEFYQEHQFGEARTEKIEIVGEEYEETVLERRIAGDEEKILDRIEGPDGQQLYVDYAGGEIGSLAPIYPTFLDESLEEQYGWLCRNCDSTETSMGSSGRIECSNCENARKATRYDKSYL